MKTNFKHKTRYEFNPSKSVTEVHKEKSMTIPGQALDIAKSIERFRRGEPIAHMTGVYTADYGIPIPEFEKMEYLERLQWAADNRERLQKQAKKILQQQKEAQEAKIKNEPDTGINNDGNPKPDSEPKPE